MNTKSTLLSAVLIAAGSTSMSIADGGPVTIGHAVSGAMAWNASSADPFDETEVTEGITAEGVVGEGTDLVLIDPWVTGDFGDGCELTVAVNTAFSDLPFNGLIFEVAAPAHIVSVTLTETSITGFDETLVLFDDDQIALNFSDMAVGGTVTLTIEYGCPGAGMEVFGELGVNFSAPDPFDDDNFVSQMSASGVVGDGTDIVLIDPHLTGDFGDGCTLDAYANMSAGAIPFNGLRFTLLDAPAPIVGVTLLGSTFPGFDASRVYFEADRIALHYGGLSGSGTVSLAIEYGSVEGDPCRSDLDDSGDTGFNDLVALLSSWGPCAGCDADLNDDGAVGFDDLVSLLAAWGPCV